MIFRILVFTILMIMLQRCTSQNTTTMEHPYTNDLVHETSPYLLQHAHNPVHWKPWSEKTLAQAQEEKKLILISIGYAACHWCHVMEHESFEDSIVAAVMNKDYINIKVDREERPDVDQVYMSAVQLMTGSGGWPLNIIALPDGRPVWGGTYFQKGQWMSALKQIQNLYTKSPEKLVEYAEKLEEGIQSAALIAPNTNTINFNPAVLTKTVAHWSKSFDHRDGGTKRVPKFMMPNNYHFLLRYAHQTKDEELLKFVNTTLTQMSYGGLYDHIGGGFSRYSTDGKWHIPHFEKMLYDNAQLVSLYADAYLLTKNNWYKQVVYETLAFVARELTNAEGAFYSSLDADSQNSQGELEEGAYYVWKIEQLKQALGTDFELFKKYYNVNSYGAWEHHNYVLIRQDSNPDFAKEQGLNLQELQEKIRAWKKTLFPIREERSRPRLDDKTLTSWNALMLKGYLDAYRVFGEKKFLDAALANAHFLKEHQLQESGALFHNYKNGKSTINGYLEDYAALIHAYSALYENTLDMQWLDTAKALADYSIIHFFDPQKNLFYFTSDQDPALVTRSIETSDNVIPASNSMMAKNLYLLSHYYSNLEYLKTARQMLHHLQPHLADYGPGYSNWLDLMLHFTANFYEVVAVGDQALEKIKELNTVYYPNKLIAGSTKNSDAPLIKGRYSKNETLLYICVNNACKYPVKTSQEALKLMKD